jgi:hypothetical protein
MEREEEIVSEMMEVSHQRDSIDNIWALIVDHVSVFQYNSTLATWFLGLNLVRFEYEPGRGRSLEIC